jgi:uncharacterized protein YdhG (YjbR/CyaY superfamily)
MPPPATIDAYLAGRPPDVREILDLVRSTLTAAAPGTTESISYGIPTLDLDGRYLLYFAGWKHHISIYPIPPGDAALQRDLAPYRSEKSTLRFPLSKPIPYELIGRVAAAALAARKAG